jgi:hypothetical protein
LQVPQLAALALYPLELRAQLLEALEIAELQRGELETVHGAADGALVAGTAGASACAEGCSSEVGAKKFPKESLVSIHVGYRMKEPQLNKLKAALRKGKFKPDKIELFRIERVHMSFLLYQRRISW